MIVKISRDCMRQYEVLIDKIYSCRTLLLINNDRNNNVDYGVNNSAIYKEYQTSKEKLVEWIYNIESEYNVKLFGNRYFIYTANNQIVIE